MQPFCHVPTVRAFCCMVIVLGVVGLAPGLRAETLSFPSNASLRNEIESPIDSYAVPTAIWADGVLPVTQVEGRMVQQAWRIEAAQLTTLQILRPLREQLRNDRYRVIFECQTEACGGFDFRFGTKTLPPPQMQINIGDFRFLSARRIGAEGPEYITLFVSRTAQAGFVQVTYIGQLSGDAVISNITAPALRSPGTPEAAGMRERLETYGHAVLADLSFDTGSSQLTPGPYSALQDLADYLRDFPDTTVALVGHTDTSGSLEGNITLSKRRAASVLERLVSEYGVRRSQLAAEGMGYLSPIATNQTEEGRTTNRRVEVIITSP